MPDWDATDAAVIAAMGETVTYTANGGSPVAIKALFQSPDTDVDTMDLNIESVGPMVTFLKTDVPTPSHVDTFRIREVPYKVKKIEKDESALVICHLLSDFRGLFALEFSEAFD